MSLPLDDLAAVLLAAAQPLPAGLRAWNGSDPAARWAVHRNNVVSSLVDALADNFPVLQQLVGEAFFRAMAAVFVRRWPPRSPILAHYGDRLPDFVADFEPAAALPYLADVARLEWSRQQALHAADAPPLDAAGALAALADASAAAVADDTRLRWHPSARLLRARHAAVSIWAAHQGEGEPSLDQIDLDRPEDALVLRDGADVLVLPLAAGAAVFAEASLAGRPLGAAAALALQPDPGFDLAAALGAWRAHGAFTGVHLPRRPEP